MRYHLIITNVALVAILNLLVCETPQVGAQHTVTQISIYYETLCPDSKRFFLQQLEPTFDKLNRYMDVELVPFGNANVSYPRHDNKPVFHCQHGPRECYGNRVQSCVIEILRNSDTSIKYVACMFNHKNWKETDQSAPDCAKQLNLEWDKIKMCVDGSEGERLLIANSLKTFNLSPEHTYVPWIVIDKNHTKELQSGAEHNLLKYLCDHKFNHEPEIEQCKQANLVLSLSQTDNAAPASGPIGMLTFLATLVILPTLWHW